MNAAAGAPTGRGSARAHPGDGPAHAGGGGPGQAGPLRARTVALDEPPDLLEQAGESGLLWLDQHGGLVGHGVAALVELPGGLAGERSLRSVARVLGSIHSSDEVGLPGCGPVAMGALPFAPSEPAHLLVPDRIVGRLGDSAWETTISGGSPPAPSAQGQALTRPAAPDRFVLEPSVPQEEWKRIVSDAVAAVRDGDLEKVVLARRVDVTANRPFVVSEVLERLVSLYPSCMVFSIERFVGASPELLVRRTGERVESHPLAGTVARSGDVQGDEILSAGLLASPKARREHRVVVDAIAAVLAPLCDELSVPDQPSVIGLRNVSHLATHLRGVLATRDGRPRPTALDIATALHPTPAVAGSPAAAAERYLQKVEGFPRGRYAGPVGWVDARGDGAWAVGIRSADLDGARAHLYAGNGIVAGSDPSEELAETQLKLQALLAALVRP